MVNDLESGTARHQEIEDTELAIVHTLCAIDQRATLDGDPSTVVCHMMVGFDATDGHIEMDTDNIALLPRTVDEHIAVNKFPLYFLTIDHYFIAREYIILEAIEVAGNRHVHHPTRNTDGKVEGFRLVLDNPESDVTVPWIVRLLLQHDLLALYLHRGSIASKQVDIESTVFHCIHIAWEGRDETAEIRRTAGTAEPWLTLYGIVGIEGILTVRRQRIGVEEATAIHRHTADDTVI